MAKEVLAEIPDQFLSYMKTNRIVPKAPVNADVSRPLPSDPESLVLN